MAAYEQVHDARGNDPRPSPHHRDADPDLGVLRLGEILPPDATDRRAVANPFLGEDISKQRTPVARLIEQ